MTTRSIILGAAALLALAAGPGCGGDAPSLSSEMDDSSYREGQQLERQGRWDEALAAYLKVIERRGDSAPESNLDAGLIYLNHLRNPIFAIYHFTKYLELEPNSRQAALVRGMIDSAKREFARSLPGQPLESQIEHLGVEEQVQRLQRENEELKAENAALRAGVAVPATHSSSIDLVSIPEPKIPAEEAPAPAAASASPIVLAPMGSGESGASFAISDAPQESPPAKAEAPKPFPPPPKRTGEVAEGGATLFPQPGRFRGGKPRPSRSAWS